MGREKRNARPLSFVWLRSVSCSAGDCCEVCGCVSRSLCVGSIDTGTVLTGWLNPRKNPRRLNSLKQWILQQDKFYLRQKGNTGDQKPLPSLRVEKRRFVC